MRDSTETGFTLLEVLVAVAILGVAMVAISRAVSDSVNNLTHLQQRAYAGQVAQNVIERRHANVLEATSGSMQFGKGQWHWQIETEVQTLAGTGIGDIEWVRVKVYRDTAKNRLITELVSVQ